MHISLNKMKKIKQLIATTIFIAILTISCGKDSPLESGDFAEASFSLSIKLPQTRAGIPVTNIEQDRITIYYGDIGQTSFQQGTIIDDSLIFNYPVLLKVGNPGKLRAIYANEIYPTIIPGAETLSDSLFVDSEDPSTLQISYNDDKYNITLNFKHCNALADFILLDDNEKEITQLIDKIFVLTSVNECEKMYVETNPKVIIPAGCSLKYVTIFLKDGKEIQFKNNTNIIFERNKRYSIQISLGSKKLIIDPEEGTDNWN